MRLKPWSMVLAGAVEVALLLPAAGVAAQSPSVAARGPAAGWTSSASWRAAVVSPARSRALSTRPMGLPASAWSPYGYERRHPPALVPGWCFPRHPVPLIYATAFVTYVGGGSVTAYPDVRADAAGTSETCAWVEVHLSGRPWRTLVALPALGARSPSSLFAAIARELSAGRQVALRTPEGTGVVLPSGPGVTGLNVYACDPIGRRR